MFQHTSWTFKILYYLTSMAPAIMLFTLKLMYLNFDQRSYDHLTILGVVLSLFILISSLASMLIYRMKKNYQNRNYYDQDYYDKDSFSIDKVSAINGDPVSFLISNITSVFLVQEQVLPSIITYIVINLMIFTMMIKTYNIQPNLFLMLGGIDIIKTKNNQFLIILNQDESQVDRIYKVTPEEEGRLHIVGETDN